MEEEVIELDPAGEGTADLIDQMAFSKRMYLQFQEDIDGFYRIQVSKKYRDRTDVCSVNYHPSEPVGELLKWMDGVLRKLSKNEL